MDRNKFLGMMKMNGDKLTSIADYLGITTNTLSRKINQRDNTDFFRREIESLATKWNLSSKDIDNIFFKNYVERNEQN